MSVKQKAVAEGIPIGNPALERHGSLLQASFRIASTVGRVLSIFYFLFL